MYMAVGIRKACRDAMGMYSSASGEEGGGLPAGPAFHGVPLVAAARFPPSLVSFAEEEEDDEEPGQGIRPPEPEEVIRPETGEKGDREECTGQGLPGIRDEGSAPDGDPGTVFLPGEDGMMMTERMAMTIPAGEG
jgi:hypothetical protein